MSESTETKPAFDWQFYGTSWGISDPEGNWSWRGEVRSCVQEDGTILFQANAKDGRGNFDQTAPFNKLETAKAFVESCVTGMIQREKQRWMA